jgi:lipid-A-disaccharide synthase
MAALSFPVSAKYCPKILGKHNVTPFELIPWILGCCKTVDEAEKELRSILPGGTKREKMLADFDELRAIIGGAGASDRFAADIVQTIQR